MIGQEHIQKTLDHLLTNNSFPHFVIITGARGSGKKLLVNSIQLPDCTKYQLEDVKIDSVRDAIVMAYKQRDKLFIIPDADNMSPAAQNSLLKVIEECPNNNYFIMTLQDTNNTLPTILSRASVFYMDIYRRDEIQVYYKQICDGDQEAAVAEICDTPGEVEMFIKYDIVEFWEYTKKVVDNIATVTGANSFKIAERVNLKDEGDGYDLKFFWRAFMNECMYRSLHENNGIYLEGIRITSKCLSKLGIKGINRQMLFDTWILDIRKVWM